MKRLIKKRTIIVMLTITMITCLAIVFSSCDFIDETIKVIDDSIDKLIATPNNGDRLHEYSDDGVLRYELSDDDSYYIVNGVVHRSITEIIIPDTHRNIPVKGINSDAFDFCSSLTSVTIPDSVTSIGDFAFSGCENLKSVHITDIAAWCGISFGAHLANPLNYAEIFYLNGEFVKEIIIPEGVTNIGAYAFQNYDFFTSVTIPDSVTSIGDSAFSGCSSLTSVTIPDSVTSIGDSAFSGCSSLTSIVVDKNNEHYKSVDGNLYSKDGTMLINYPKGKSDRIFTIPNSVTSIVDNAFAGCDSLTSVTIPDSVTSIGDFVFSGCKNLTSVTIPDSVTSIGDYAFYGCSSLTSVTIPDSVTSISIHAFYFCSSLTSVTIPDSVTSIGDYAFGNCTWLENVVYKGSVLQWNLIDKGSDWDVYSGSYTIYCTDGTISNSGIVTYK